MSSDSDPRGQSVEAQRYRRLDAQQIVRTAETLCLRIEERFPDANLTHVARALESVARATAGDVARLQAPNWWVRIPVAVAITAALALVAWTVAELPPQTNLLRNLFEFAQGLEAVINQMIFLGLAILFLTRLETRLKRTRALRAIHTLRSLAHIVDMHQLTKDPERVTASLSNTPSSPQRTMAPVELMRYLDYCSEMLALISKLAALHAQSLADEVVLGAVAEVETMAHGLSRNIWQKIMIIDRAQHAAAARSR
jgi:hypothetical protein